MSSVSSVCQKDDWEVTWLQPRTASSKRKGKAFKRLFKLTQNIKNQCWMKEKNSGSKAPGFLPQKKLSLQPRSWGSALLKSQNEPQILSVRNAVPRSCWAVTQGSSELTDARKWRVMGDGWQALSGVHTSRAFALQALLEVLAQDPKTAWVFLGNVTTAVACTKSFHSSLTLLRGVQWTVIWSHFILKQLLNPQRGKAMCKAPAHKQQARPGTPLAHKNHHQAWMHPLQGCFEEEHCSPGLWTSFFCTCPIQVLSHQLGAHVLLLNASLQKQRGFQTLFHFIYPCKRLLFIAEAAQLRSSAKLHPPISLLVPRSLDVKPACALLLV